MITFDEKIDIQECKIEYEATIAIAQYENLKPKISITITDKEKASAALDWCRGLLREQYNNIKKAHNKE